MVSSTGLCAEKRENMIFNSVIFSKCEGGQIYLMVLAVLLTL